MNQRSNLCFVWGVLVLFFFPLVVDSAVKAQAAGPVEIKISSLPPVSDNVRRFLVEAENRTAQDISGEIQVSLPQPSAGVRLEPRSAPFTAVRPGGSASIAFSLRGKISEDQRFLIRAEATLAKDLRVQAEQWIGFYPCFQSEEVIQIDGDLGDWSRKTPIRINWRQPTARQERPTIDSPAGGAVAYACWDENTFYIAAEICDATRGALHRGSSLCKNDGIEILFDVEPWKNPPGLQARDPNVPYGIFDSPAGATFCSGPRFNTPSAGAKAAMVRSEALGPEKSLAGFIVEGAIPLSELGLEPYSGMRIGFNIAFCDNDDPSGVNPPGKGQRLSWMEWPEAEIDPRSHGDLFLIDPKAKGIVRIQGTTTRIDGEPFFPLGFWTFGQSEERFRRLREMGVNTVGTTFLWRDLEPQNGRFDSRARDRCLAFLDLAYKYRQKVLVQLEIHPEPEWLFDTYANARLQKADGTPAGSDYMNANVLHPGLKTELRQFLGDLIPKIKNHPAVLAYSPWNEPSWSGEVDYSATTLQAYRDYLKKTSRKTAIQNVGQMKNLADIFRFKEAIENVDAGASEARALTVEQIDEDRQAWLQWMRFRQEAFAGFFKWYRGLLRGLDSRHPVTLKQIWKPLDSRLAWASATNYEAFGEFIDVAGSDPYPHPFDFFINRWISDWNRSAAKGKPRWFLEFNRAFVDRFGQTSAPELRSGFWQGVSRGMNGALFFFWPMQPFDPAWGDNRLAFLYADTLEPTPAAQEIARLAASIDRAGPWMAGAEPRPAQIAILHDWNTLFQMPGDSYPTAGATALAEMFYRSHLAVDYISEYQVKQGALERYRILGLAGTVASDDETLEKIRQFHDSGGALIAIARFGERDERFAERPTAPPPYFGLRVLERKEVQRKEAPPVEVSYEAHGNDRSLERKTAARARRSGTPVRWEAARQGYPFQAKQRLREGPILGFEDMDRERETIERIEATTGRILARFPEGEPAVVESDRTLYIAKDLSYSGEGWRKLIDAFARRQGVTATVRVLDENSEDAPHVEASLLEGPKGNLLLLVNAPRLYHYKGERRRLSVVLQDDAAGDTVRDLLQKATLPLEKNPSGSKEFSITLGEGEIRLFHLEE